MPHPSDLPAMAWDVLDKIGCGAPMTGENPLRWVRAFEQIHWVTSIGGRLALTAAGAEALRERRIPADGVEANAPDG